MDLFYMPEVLTYGSFRTPVYRDYEQPWNKDYFNNGNSTRLQQEQLQHQQNRANQKEHCQLCKENKRRTLGAYIRKKSKSTCSEIHEENEDDTLAAENHQKKNKTENKS